MAHDADDTPDTSWALGGVVTAVRSTKRDPMRVTVRVAGRVVVTLPREQADELGIGEGVEWTAALAEQTDQAAAMDKAKRDALSRLNRRALSRRELARKLRDKGHADAAIEPVLDRLTEVGLLDDAAFGRALIRELRARKPAGPRLLKSKLFQKGLDGKLIDELIAEASQDNDDVAAATRLARQRARSLERYDEKTRTRRLWGMLARRGFDTDVIRQALDALGGADDVDDM